MVRPNRLMSLAAALALALPACARALEGSTPPKPKSALVTFTEETTQEQFEAFLEENKAWYSEYDEAETDRSFLFRLEEGKTYQDARELWKKDPRVQEVDLDPNEPLFVPFSTQGVSRNEVEERLSEKPKTAAEVAAAREIAGRAAASDFEGLYDGNVERSGSALRDSVSAAGFTVAQGKPLPPPPGSGQDTTRTGKPLPPPPGQGGGDSGRGKPLPPPPGVRHPEPVYPGGPLPTYDDRLRGAYPVPILTDPDDLTYIGYWEGQDYYESDSALVRRSGDNPGTSYVARLSSSRVEETIYFYYDNVEKEYYYEKVGRKTGRPVEREVTVEFLDQQQSPLLPWENEQFTVSFNGGSNGGITFRTDSGSYRYTYRVVRQNRGTLHWTVEVTPGQKLKTAPDRRAIQAELKSTGTGLELEVSDRWAQYYAGESLEIAYVIRWDDGSWWSRDPVVEQKTTRAPMRLSPAGVMSFGIAASKGRGKYYLESWSWRRANSALSTDGWVNMGKGNTVSH